MEQIWKNLNITMQSLLLVDQGQDSGQNLAKKLPNIYSNFSVKNLCCK